MDLDLENRKVHSVPPTLLLLNYWVCALIFVFVLCRNKLPILLNPPLKMKNLNVGEGGVISDEIHFCDSTAVVLKLFKKNYATVP